MTTSERRAGGNAIFRWIAAQLESHTRRIALGVIVLATAARASGLIAVEALATADLDRTLAVAVPTGLVLLAQRFLAGRLRLLLETNLRMGAARAMLDADVLEEPSVEPHLALSEGLYTSTTLVETVPALVADAAVALPTCVLVALRLPRSTFAGLIVTMAAALFASLALRRYSESFQARAADAQRAFGERFASIVSGRLEIVANGVKDAAERALRTAAESYVVEARRSSATLALVGRGPTIVGLLIILVILFGRSEVAVAVRADPGTFALLAYAGSLLLALLTNVQTVQRARTKLRPFGSIVLRPRRAERERLGTPPPSVAKVSFDTVRFGYRPDVVALEVSQRWEAGLLLIRGRNGSGKSTALRLIAGLRAPDEGDVRVDQRSLTNVDLRAWRRRLAFLPQRPYLGELHETVASSFELLLQDAARERAETALARVGLPDVGLEQLVGHLSIGQRQRVAIARVLARNADLLLLDEPDANLDAEGIDRLVAIIEEEVAAGKMVAIAAHGPIAERLRGTVWDL